jgi:hypothetical protein
MEATQKTIEKALEPLNKGLEAKDRAITVVRCDEEMVAMTLEGFCCTACDCVAVFKSRVRQIVKSSCPEINQVTFE